MKIFPSYNQLFKRKKKKITIFYTFLLIKLCKTFQFSFKLKKEKVYTLQIKTK